MSEPTQAVSDHEQEPLFLVHTAAFDGPIELLLTLAQRAELELKTFALASLTDEYLRALDVERPPPHRMAAFLVIGARLVQLKAAQLMPGEMHEEDEDLHAWEEAIKGRLQEYKRFKELADSLMQRHASGRFTFAGLFEPEVIPEAHIQVQLDVLAAAFQQVLDRLPPAEALTVEMEPVSLTDKLEQLRTMLRQHGEMNFTAVFAQSRTRLEAVVTFLALLELIRIGEITVVQPAPFSPIRIRTRQDPKA